MFTNNHNLEHKNTWPHFFETVFICVWEQLIAFLACIGLIHLFLVFS